MALSDDLVTDSVTTARLVELACISLDRVSGGLPASALGDREPGHASLEFRRLARACTTVARCTGSGAPMTHDERREAACTAVDSLVAAIDMA